MSERGSKGSEFIPGQEEERLSAGGVEFAEALRRGLAGLDEPKHEQQERKGMMGGEGPGCLDRELSDEELVAIWDATMSGVKDGALPTFADRAGLREDIRRRIHR